MKKIQQFVARAALNRYAPQMIVVAVGSVAGAISVFLSRFTIVEDAIEEFVRTLLDSPTFALNDATVFGLVFLGVGWTMDKLINRYQVQLSQTALGGLFIDGRIGQRTIQRAIELKLVAREDGLDQENYDVIGVLFPDASPETEQRAREQAAELKSFFGRGEGRESPPPDPYLDE